MVIARRLASQLDATTVRLLILAIAALVAHFVFGLEHAGWILLVGAGPVTLAQASLNAASDIDRNIIDEFRKSSFLLDRLPFDDAVNPAGGGSTLVYGYTRQITQRGAAFRAINAEYTPQEVTKAQYVTNLRPLGGSFQIDRVLTGIGAVSEVTFQLDQLVKASRAYFADQAINGNSAVTPDGFDGLNKALVGSITEYNAGGAEDWTVIDTQVEALVAVQRINRWLALMDGRPDAIFANSVALSWFTMIAALSGQLRSTTNAFGQVIDTFRDIPLVDLGDKAGTSVPVVGYRSGANEIQTLTASTWGTSGTFTLTLLGQTTAPIAFNASAATIVAALAALPGNAGGDFAGGGGPIHTTPVTVTFQGKYASMNVPLMASNLSGLVGGTPALAIVATTPGGTDAITDLYAVRFGLDGFHGVSVTGPLLKQWLPDFSVAGAVKTGEVELGPVSIALKSQKAAAVYRNIKVGA